MGAFLSAFAGVTFIWNAFFLVVLIRAWWLQYQAVKEAGDKIARMMSFLKFMVTNGFILTFVMSGAMLSDAVGHPYVSGCYVLFVQGIHIGLGLIYALITIKLLTAAINPSLADAKYNFTEPAGRPSIIYAVCNFISCVLLNPKNVE